MKHELQLGRLDLFRAYLKHFDQSPDFGDAETVEAIRRHLLVRIREEEGAARCSTWSQSGSEAA